MTNSTKEEELQMKIFRFFKKSWFIKLCLFAIFVANTGIIGIFTDASKHAIDNPSSTLPPIEISRRVQRLESFIEEILSDAQRQQTRGFYSLSYYARDLERIYLKETELQVVSFVSIHKINELAVRAQKWGAYSPAEIRRVQENLRKKYPRAFGFKENSDPLPTWGEVSFWFFKQYLFHMPLALILIFLWFRKEREEKTEKNLGFPKIFRLGLILLAYPAVLFWVFQKWWREKERRYRTEAEYRRYQRKLFTFLSPEEKKQIEEFSRHRLPVEAVRKHFISIGLKPQYCLLAAFLAVFLFSLLPKPGKCGDSSASQLVALGTQLAVCQSFDHLPRDKITDDRLDRGGGHAGQISGLPDMALGFSRLRISVAAFRVPAKDKLIPITEFVSEIMHIPISAAGFGITFLYDTHN